jgi:hypothetical protein
MSNSNPFKFFRKSFPSPGLSYYIKTQSGLQNGQFLYDSVGSLRSSANDSYRKEFKFTKNTDGTFSIDSQVKLCILYLKHLLLITGALFGNK